MSVPVPVPVLKDNNDLCFIHPFFHSISSNNYYVYDTNNYHDNDFNVDGIIKTRRMSLL